MEGKKGEREDEGGERTGEGMVARAGADLGDGARAGLHGLLELVVEVGVVHLNVALGLAVALVGELAPEGLVAALEQVDLGEDEVGDALAVLGAGLPVRVGVNVEAAELGVAEGR